MKKMFAKKERKCSVAYNDIFWDLAESYEENNIFKMEN